MNVFFEKYLVYIFLFSCFFLGGFILGPYSIRIYVTIMTVGYLLIQSYKFPFIKEINIYLLFILFYVIALYANGELTEINFIKYFLGRYFVCFIAFFALYRLIKTKSQLNSVIKFICIIGILNAALSLLQYFGFPFAIAVSEFFNPVLSKGERFDVINRFVDGNSSGIGAFGFFASSVANGYFSVIPTVLILYFLKNTENIWQKIMLYGSVMFLLCGLFVVQQRFVLLLTGAFYIYYIYLNTKHIMPVLLILFIATAYIFLNTLNVGKEDLGRLQDLSDNERVKIYQLSIKFIQNNFLFGGQLDFGKYLQNNGVIVFSSHNFVFNALIYSGVFGGIILIYLYILMIKRGLVSIFRFQMPQFFIAVALVIYLLTSLTHNSSLVTGDEIIWILFGLLLVSIKINNYQIKLNENTLRDR